MNKILSISIAAYNVETVIEQAISSCLLEEYIDKIEIIVVNDGSTDRTVERCDKYLADYGNCLKIVNKSNGGYGSTINKAIEAAEGKYLKLLDGDDWFDSNNLKRLVDSLLNIDADLVLTDFIYFYEEEHKEKSCSLNMLANSKFYISEIDDSIQFLMPNVCYKTELLRKHKIQITEKCFYTDMEFVIEPLKYVKEVVYLPYKVYIYRFHNMGQSVSIKGIKKHYEDSYVVLKKILKDVHGDNSSSLYKYQVALYAKKVLENYLIGMPKGIEGRLAEIDDTIRKESEDVYYKTNNHMITFLRYSRYKLWFICSLYCYMRIR